MAATAALWSAAAALSGHAGAPRAAVSAPLPAIRRAQMAVRTTGAPLHAPLMARAARAVAPPTVGAVATSATLVALALPAVAAPRRDGRVTVPARLPLRGRASPWPVADHRTARTRTH
ncbi:hypothetical protein ACNTMW_14070 [Planosporangium sp. 12N6]|uniref:hypothetical protein n=1 Tax=Planosporangium spinosum TaxID=3402278 RepID=UPI003CF5514E